MGKTIVFLILLFVCPAAYAVNYTVGDDAGWTTNFNYTDWARNKTFTTGDTLVFTYGSFHSVDEVSRADYQSCSAENPISSHSPSPTVITLNATGPLYFLCPTPRHCSLGQRLAINVTAGSTPSDGSPPSTAVPPPAPPSAAGTLGGGNSWMVGLMPLVLAAVVG